MLFTSQLHSFRLTHHDAKPLFMSCVRSLCTNKSGVCNVSTEKLRDRTLTLPLDHLGPDINVPLVVYQLHHRVVVPVVLDDPGVDDLPQGAVRQLTEKVHSL